HRRWVTEELHSFPTRRASDLARVGGVVEHERGVLAPGGEQALLEPGAADLLEPDGRDDLVGVDVAAAQRHGLAGVRGEGFHRYRSEEHTSELQSRENLVCRLL